MTTLYTEIIRFFKQKTLKNIDFIVFASRKLQRQFVGTLGYVAGSFRGFRPLGAGAGCLWEAKTRKLQPKSQNKQ